MSDNSKPREPSTRSSRLWLTLVGLVLLGALSLGLWARGQASDHPGGDSCGASPVPEGMDSSGWAADTGSGG